jgi:NADH pyrophosphatase NudC (nudix superfamily)
MKLFVKQFCVHCQKYGEFKCEDTRMKQILYCPNCGKEHYRQLDDEVIAKIRSSRNV